MTVGVEGDGHTNLHKPLVYLLLPLQCMGWCIAHGAQLDMHRLLVMRADGVALMHLH